MVSATQGAHTSATADASGVGMTQWGALKVTPNRTELLAALEAEWQNLSPGK